MSDTSEIPVAPTRFGRFVDATIFRLGHLPTTQIIVSSGVLAFCGTILLWWLMAVLSSLFGHYEIPEVGPPVWVSKFYPWEPSTAMTTFISAWGVIAAAQFTGKRATDRGLAAAKAKGTTTTTTAPPGSVTTTEQKGA